MAAPHAATAPATAGAAGAARSGWLARAWAANGAGYMFLLPWLIGFLVLTLGPALISLYLSFTNFDLLRPPTWVGTENYQRIFTADAKFMASMRVTLFFVIFSVPLKLAFALARRGRAQPRHQRPAALPRDLLPAVADRHLGRDRRALAPALRPRRPRQHRPLGGVRHPGPELDLATPTTRSGR